MSDPVHLTYDDVKRDLLELAEANPTRKAACMNFTPIGYNDDGNRIFSDEPMCIAGHVYAKYGLVPSKFPSGSENIALCGSGVYTVASFDFLKFDTAAMSLLYQAQINQDQGFPWHDAVKFALQAVPADEQVSA